VVARDGIEPPTQAFSGPWLLGPSYVLYTSPFEIFFIIIFLLSILKINYFFPKGNPKKIQN